MKYQQQIKLTEVRRSVFSKARLACAISVAYVVRKLEDLNRNIESWILSATFSLRYKILFVTAGSISSSKQRQVPRGSGTANHQSSHKSNVCTQAGDERSSSGN